MTRKYSSVSIETTLSGTINSSVTSLVVATSTATTLMGGVTLSGGNVDQFAIAVDPETASEEIMWVTAVAGDTLTIVRAQAGSTGISHLSGATIRHVFTGNDAQYFQDTLLAPAFSSAGVTFAGSTSGTTTVAATAVASGTLTLPAATDTLVGKATTDNLSNKTLSASKFTYTLNAQTGTTYTLVAGDQDKIVTLTNAAAITLTVPAAVFSAGQIINLLQLGAGQVTIVGDGTSTVNSHNGLKIAAQYGLASVICTASNTFVVVGDVTA